MSKAGTDMDSELNHCIDAIRELARGNVEVTVSEDSSHPLMGQLGAGINKMVAIYKENVDQSMELSLAIAQFLNVLQQVADGDMKARVPTDFKEEVLTALGQGINNTIEKIAERSALEELLKELSTPVLHAWDQVIVMPLIGTLTSDRAQEAMEKLLHSITEYHAKVALIDITGVPVIDSMVANHLIKTINAVKILGSEAVITGISAEVASILVHIGITLDNFMTRSTLREGLQYAIRVTEKNT